MCSYCGCQSLETIGRLMDEHVEVVNATGDLRRACEAADVEGVRRCAREVARLLGPHTDAEEVGLFAVMKEMDEFHDHITTLCGEHTTLDALLARVEAGHFDEVTAFEKALRAHIDKEDNGLFPAAAVALSGEDWERVLTQEAPYVSGAAVGPHTHAELHAHDHAHPHDHSHDHGEGHGHAHTHEHA